MKKTFNTNLWSLCACAQIFLHTFEYTYTHVHTHIHAKNNLRINKAEHYQREELQMSNGKKEEVNLRY